MKKRIFVFLTVCLLTACSAAWADYWDEGHEGTASSPYIIDTIADLQALRDRVNNGTEPEGKYYKLTKNLTISQYTDWEHIGTEAYPFKGHFNGNSLSIHVNITANHVILEPGSTWREAVDTHYSALFGTISTSDGYAVKGLTVSGTVKGSSSYRVG